MGHLEEERALADAWLTPDEHHGTRHDAAAENAVELCDAGEDSRLVGHVHRVVGLGLAHPFEGEDTLTGPSRGRRGHLLPLLDETVPLAAIRAPAEPLGALEAAGLALEHGANGLAHGRNRSSTSVRYPR